MAGAFRVPGNITPDAEFNVLQDPESYRTVLHAAGLTFLPLDVTTQLSLAAADMARLADFAVPSSAPSAASLEPPAPSAPSTAAAHAAPRAGVLLGFLRALWRFSVEQTLNFKQSRGQSAMLVHDAAAVAYLLYPGLFGLRRASVHVDCAHGRSRGRTSMDERVALSGDPTNALVALSVNAQDAVAALVEDLQNVLERLGSS